MKVKIILTIFFGTLIAIIIFNKTYQEEMNIVTIGDGLSLGYTAYNVKGYSFNDYLKDYYEENSIIKEYITETSQVDETTLNLINKIANNEKLSSKNLTYQQAISNAKIITISLGMDELNNLKTIKNKNIEAYLTNMEKICGLIRNFNKKEIFIIGLYETSKLKPSQVDKINNALEELAQNNKMHFIKIDAKIKNEFYFNDQSYYINYKGHQVICEEILRQLN